MIVEIENKTLLQPGRNCWRLLQAKRVAFLIDGEAYFAALRAAVKRARRSILIVGWDIDSKVRLLRDNRPHQWPVELGDFLNAMVSERHDLQAHILIWDFPMIYAPERELLPIYTLQWRTHHRMHFYMDDKHPAGACQHQKIVVVDNAVAFVGGFDLTKQRWDTSEHRGDDPRRIDSDGKPYPPFHDVQMMVDGEAAAALGELARERWRRATGEEIHTPMTDNSESWPPYLKPDMEEVELAIARTEPAYADHPRVREVEQLHLDAIASARHNIYIENQYLTSATVGKALAARLGEAQGPQIVLVLPYQITGWLEHTTMDVLRARLLRELRRADRYHRLRVYYPHAPGLGEDCIDLHSKILLVDDALVRIGSSNLSNRSMGLDSECDLAVAAAGKQPIKEAIAGLRHRLLAEHLGIEPKEMAQAQARQGSLIAAIEALRGGERTLRDLDGEVAASLDETIPDSSIVDPERPLDPEVLIDKLVPDEERKPASRRLISRVAIIVAMLALAAIWQWTPLEEWLDADTIAAWIAGIRNSPIGAVTVIMAFLVGGLVAFPVTVLIVATALVFGPVLGFTYSLVGALLSAVVTYGIGHALGRNTIRRLAGSRINQLSRWLARRGIVTMLTIRILPVAPFTVINMVAGASHIRFRDYLLGTVLGMIPGMLALTIFANGIYRAVSDPQPENFVWLAGVVALIAVAVFTLRRWLIRRGKAKKSTSKDSA